MNENNKPNDLNFSQLPKENLNSSLKSEKSELDKSSLNSPTKVGESEFCSQNLTWLIYGSQGWIGQQVCELLKPISKQVIYGKARCDLETDVELEILNTKPDRIISLIGRTSGPGYNTIDYLEQPGKLNENIKDNLFSPVILASLAVKYKIHFTYLGTGCIFDGDENGYDENAKPDFFGSSYSTVKGFTDRLMHILFNDTVLNIRIRMPIVSDVHPKNFITKITNYEKICSIPNSMTNLDELLPKMIIMAQNKIVGTINLTNPGLISHNKILTLYKEIVDKDFVWKNFTKEEQSTILLGGRSNNLLLTTKLENLFPDVLPIKESVKNALILMKKKIDEEKIWKVMEVMKSYGIKHLIFVDVPLTK